MNQGQESHEGEMLMHYSKDNKEKRTFCHLDCPLSNEELRLLAEKKNTSIDEITNEWFNHIAEMTANCYISAKKENLSFVDYINRESQKMMELASMKRKS